METHRNGGGSNRRGIRFEQSRLLLVSNRGPIEHGVDATGHLTGRGCAGGVATALGCASDGMPVTWIAGAMSEADRLLAAEGPVELGDGKLLRLVAPPAEAYDLSYGTFCNRILWFLQHGLWPRLDRATLERDIIHAWEYGYLPVNQAFAEAVVDELRRRDDPGRVMLHDYHLYAAPILIRNLCPRATLQHFIHIPWPAPDAWKNLPEPIVTSICGSLLANDSVVFQTEMSAHNFLHTCRAFISDAEVYFTAGLVAQRGRRTHVWANPISVDVSDLQSRLASPESRAYREKLGGALSERTIVRVDRLDPSKNVYGGFQAFSLLLQKYPEWRGRVSFLACLVPSRTGVPEYRAYGEEVFGLVDAINNHYGTRTWQPITVLYEHNRPQALVALSLYDVLLVNSLLDGMNLISKEGPVVNQRDGVLVLSTAAGSYDALRDAALAVLPDDIEGTADALAQALSLPPAERRHRARQLRQAVFGHQLGDWLRLLLQDLADIEASQAREPVMAGVR